MTVRVYRSTDTNAPQCSGEVGKLIAILSACLVDGYSPGTVSSITRSGATATLTFSAAHGLADFTNRLTVAGAAQSEYNGEFDVTVISATAVTYTVSGTPATPATGSPTATKAGSGWTKPYSGTNLAAYKQGSGSNGFYLRIDDTGTTSARIIGYETMSSISDTSGNAFPTEAQQSGGGYYNKSSTADATARAWIVVATESGFYLWINHWTNSAVAQLHFLGDIQSRKSGDAFHTLNACSHASSNATTSVPALVTTLSNSVFGNWLARSYTQTGVSITAGKHINDVASKGSAIMGTDGEAYPSPVSSGLLMSLVFVHENTAAVVRGIMPGLLAPLHNSPLDNLDTFSGTGAYAGKKYLSLDVFNAGQAFVEISNTW